MLARIILGGAAAVAALFLSGCRRQEPPAVRNGVPQENPLNQDLKISTSKFSPPPPPVAPALAKGSPGDALQTRSALFNPSGPQGIYSVATPAASILPRDPSAVESSLPTASPAATLYRSREYAKAIEAAQSELSSNPQSPALYFILGASYGQEQNFPEAARSLETALQLDPNNARSHFALGSCYLKMHQAESGLLHLKKAEILNPDLKPLIASLLEGEEIPRAQKFIPSPEPAYEERFD